MVSCPSSPILSNMSVPSPEGRRRRRLPRVIAALIAALVALALVVVGGYLWRVNHTVNQNLDHEQLLPTSSAQTLVVPQNASGNLVSPDGAQLADDQGQPIDATTMHIDAKGQVVDAKNRPMLVLDGTALPRLDENQAGVVLMGVKSNALAQPKRQQKSGDSLNYLILGRDNGSDGASRADVIVLAHISSDRKRIDLIHVPRDLYVPIPGYGSNKINAAYAYGGAPLLVQTLQPLVGVPIDQVAITDFNGFSNTINSIGGITLSTASGSQTMNGAQALAWVRERKTLAQGDISRGQRQMQMIRAVLVKGLSRSVVTNPAKLQRFIDAGTSNMTVDESLTTSKIRSLAISLRNVRGDDVHMLSSPWVSAGPGPHRMSIVTMSEPQMQVLAEHLQNDTMSTYTDPISPTSGFGPR